MGCEKIKYIFDLDKLDVFVWKNSFNGTITLRLEFLLWEYTISIQNVDIQFTR